MIVTGAIESGHGRRTIQEMHLFSAHCRVCRGDQFRAEPAEGWVEKMLLPRLSSVQAVALFATSAGICRRFSDGRRCQTRGDDGAPYKIASRMDAESPTWCSPAPNACGHFP
jgi:hypothetical protein